MAKHVFLNLDSVSNLFRDREIINSPGLVKTFSSFKKAKTRLLRLGKQKSDEEFAKKKEIPAHRQTNLEDLNFSVNRPKRCFCNKPKSQSKWRSRLIDIGSKTRLALGKKSKAVITNQPDIENIQNQSGMSNHQTEKSTIVERPPESSPRVSKNIVNPSILTSIQAESEKVGTEGFNSPNNVDRISENIAKISKANGIWPETENPENNAMSRTPEKRGSLEDRKSSIKSQRISLTVAEKSMKTIGEINSETGSQKSGVIQNGIIDLGVIKELETELTPVEESIDNKERGQPIVDLETVTEEEQPVQFEVVKISRKEFDNLKQEKNVERIIRIDHKTSSPDGEDLSALLATETENDEEWRDIPVPVINEIRRVTKTKRHHICSKACPCKFSQELINIYHEAKELSEVANKISEERNHCKFRMTSSEIDFFKGDNKMCNVMIAETQSRRAEMRELMDMWQEASEKLATRKKETVSISESIEKTGKRMVDIENLLKDWLPGEQMEKLRKAQRAAEKRNQERIEMLEDETRILCQKKIEEIVQKREARQAEEMLREEKRKIQQQKDTLSLENATNLLQKYIDERKALFIQ